MRPPPEPDRRFWGVPGSGVLFSPGETMVPFLGHGIGLRTTHFPDLLEQGRRADWFEVITENFLNVGGRPRAVLEAVRADVPVVLILVRVEIVGS